MGEEKKEKDKDKEKQAVAPKPEMNVITSFLANPRLLRILAYVVAIILFVYMLIAILSFLGIIPSGIAKKLPVVGGVIEKAEEKKKFSQMKTVAPYELDTKVVYPKFSRNYRKENPFVLSNPPTKNSKETADEVVVKRKFYEGKNVGEIYLNDQLVMRIYNGVNFPNQYARADAVAQNLQKMVSQNVDLMKLLPKVVEGDMCVAYEDKIVTKVYDVDAIINNSTSLQQAVAWINNIRVARGISTFLKSEDYEELSAQVTANTKVEVKKEDAPVISDDEKKKQLLAEQKKTEAQKEQAKAVRKKQLKKIVKVYEAMPSGEAVDIMNKMSDKEAAEILAFMQDRKLSKIMSLMPPVRAVRLTQMIQEMEK